MVDRCIEVEELARLTDGEMSAEHRAHLDGCPRCRARYAAYLRFMAGAGEVPAEELVAARRRLVEELRGRIESPTPQPGLAPRRPAGREPARRRFGGWLRPVLAGAALALVIALLPVFRPNRPATPERPQLRGESTRSARLRTESPEPNDLGGLRLRWTALAEATSYRVCLLDAELNEVASFEAGADTTFTLSAEDLRLLQAADRALAWRVRALNGADEIQHSAPRALTAGEDPAE